ncbi:hypothetical protein MKC66_16260 [[Clostridium] innocuum]|nr:hypothetical protein [[Clostridium] innocuum]
MKVYMVLASCYIFLDIVHFREKIYILSTKGIALLEKYYHMLTEEDISLALSFYDYQNHVLTIVNNDNYQDQNKFFTEVLMPAYDNSIMMLNRFKEQADENLPLNQVFPLFEESWAVNIFYYVYKQEDGMLDKRHIQRMRQLVEQRYLLSKNSHNEKDPTYLCDKAFYIAYKQRNNELDAHRAFMEINALWECLPLKKFTNWEDFNSSAMDAFVLMSFILKQLAKDDEEKHKILVVKLDEIIDTLVGYGSNNYLEYFVDSFSYIYLIPLIQYLPDEKQALSHLVKLTIFRQPQTAVHSIIVGKCASAILNYMIDDLPELFIDLLDEKTTDEVLKHKEDFLDYISNASLIHDIGKILCVNVVNMQYRKLIDVEYETIQFHPLSSGEILNQIPQLKCYHDIAVGHHKSFDDLSGYPKEFHTSQSRQKLLIDLISICDSLDAATDYLGRNYAKSKSFEDVFAEFERGKGTRYSDTIVDYIKQKPLLKKELKGLVEKGREDVYSEVLRKCESIR